MEIKENILVIDLSARLPYEVKVSVSYGFGQPEIKKLCVVHISQLMGNSCTLKPYLRPMSSMTEEEIVEINSMGFAYWTTMINNDLRTKGPMSLLDAIISHYKMVKLLDWLNAHHFDYRGLIKMGLALEAPEGMYNFK